MAGYASLDEIDNYWTYRDILTCINKMDRISVQNWKAINPDKPKQKTFEMR